MCLTITPTELIRAVNQAYGISADAVQQCGPIRKVHSLKGIFAFREMKTTPEILKQLAEVLETFKKNGFPNIASFLPTKTGEPFLTLANRNYVLLKWYEGETPLLASQHHLQKTAKLYSKFHKISKKITLPESWPLRNCLSEFQAKTIFLKELLSRLKSEKTLNRIDRAIINHGEHFLKQAELSIQGLSDLKFREWLPYTTEKGFCHHDPAPANIIIQNQNWILIDFELSAFDAFIKEFTILTARVLQANNWDYKISEILKNAYADERAFSNEELDFLPYILCFPQRFWRLCSQRFEEKLDWTENHYWRKLWDIVNDEKNRFQFLTKILPEI